MKRMSLSGKQKKGILKIILVISVILYGPIIVNRLTGWDTINVLFLIVVIYAAIAWKMNP